MTCPVLASLIAAIAAVEALPVPCGLGADIVLDEQLPVLAGLLARLQRQLAMRMAAAERAAPGVSDVRGDAVRAGLDPRRAGLLRRAGMFTDTHGDLGTAWRTGQVRLEQIELLRVGSTKVRTQQRRRLITDVLPLLPGLDERATRQLIDVAVDHLNPGDPDHDEQAETRRPPARLDPDPPRWTRVRWRASRSPERGPYPRSVEPAGWPGVGPARGRRRLSGRVDAAGLSSSSTDCVRSGLAAVGGSGGGWRAGCGREHAVP